MEIIKPGRIKQGKEFTCYGCGCVFEAKYDEYKVRNESVSDNCSVTITETTCPCCSIHIQRKKYYYY